MAAAFKQNTAEMLFTHKHKLLDKFKLLLSNKMNVQLWVHAFKLLVFFILLLVFYL